MSQQLSTNYTHHTLSTAAAMKRPSPRHWKMGEIQIPRHPKPLMYGNFVVLRFQQLAWFGVVVWGTMDDQPKPPISTIT